MTSPRFLDLLVSPSRAFARTASQPQCLRAYLAIVMVMGCAVALTVPNLDSFEAARRILENAGGDGEQSAGDVASTAATLRTLQTAYGFLGPAVGLLVVALVLMVVFRVASGRSVAYATSLEVVSFAALPLALRSVMTAVVAELRGPVSLAELDRGTVVASNPAALLPADAPPLAVGLLSHVDGFVLYSLFLCGLGFATVLGGQPTRAVSVVFAVWALMIVLPSVALSAILG